MKKLIILTIFVLLVSGCSKLNPHEKYYAGEVRHFRANLNEAEKISVYPSEESIKNLLLDPKVYKVRIAYFPNETENSYYFASSFEITIKLGIIFRHKFQGNQPVSIFTEDDESSCLLFHLGMSVKCFKSLPINSTDELVSTDVEPVILLLGPSHANQTAVTIEHHLITLEGKSFEEVDRTYTDLDLSVDKMLLVLMED